jgi:LemA protein
MSKITAAILGGIVLLGLWVMSGYNSLVNLEENTDNSFSKIETQYQRRFDLIPNLVSTVKGSANFEQETLQGVVEARSAWANAGTSNEKINAGNSFDSALSRLLVTVEAYPDIKSTTAFNNLSIELEGTESRITFARNEYNDTATNYNKSARLFPKNLLVALLGFDKEKSLFEATAGAEDAVKVDFTKTPATPTPEPVIAQ